MNEFEQQYLPGGLPPAFSLGLFRTEHFILGAGDRLDFPDCPRFGEPEYQQTKLRQKLFLHLHSGGDCDSASELCWATAGHVAICRSDVSLPLHRKKRRTEKPCGAFDAFSRYEELWLQR